MERKILLFDNPLLRKKCKPVRSITSEIQKIVKDMAETMYENNGVGLAAIQIGELLRIILVDVSESRDQLIVLFNPQIIEHSEKVTGLEACLSVPKLEGKVTRYKKVVIKAKDYFFNDVEIEAEDYLARAFQHEIDHLDGKIYTDKVIKGTLQPVEKTKDY